VHIKLWVHLTLFFDCFHGKGNKLGINDFSYVSVGAEKENVHMIHTQKQAHTH
jgi:hypothetical protein